MKKLAVIIVTYNSEAHIYDCLKSLFEFNDIGDALEVIIVDNCSREYRALNLKIKELYNDKVNVIANDRNGGYGYGNNVGIRASTAPVIMIMNPDVRLITPVFKAVCNIFEFRPNIVQVGLKQIHPGQKNGYSFSWTSSVLPYISMPLLYLTKKLDIFIPRYMYFAGSCFCVSKAAFEEIGLFDENIFLYHEEEDVHQRFQKQQIYKLVYLRTGKYIHLHLPNKESLDKNFTTFKQGLESLEHLFVKRGLTEVEAVKRELQKFNMLILKEKLLCVLGKGNKNYLNYIENWRKILREKLK